MVDQIRDDIISNSGWAGFEVSSQYDHSMITGGSQLLSNQTIPLSAVGSDMALGAIFDR